MGFWEEVSELVASGSLLYIYVLCASGLVVVLLLWHVLHAFRTRLWLLPAYPSKLLALNAGTLALLSIIAKIPSPGDEEKWFSSEYYMLMSSVLICVMIGALFPSIATSPDLSDMWSNVAAVSLLLLTAILTIFLQCHNEIQKKPNFFFPTENDPYVAESPYNTEKRPAILKTRLAHTIMMGILFGLLLVLLTQALALQSMIMDVKDTVSEKLEQLHNMQMKPGYKASVINVEMLDWSWEIVERNTRVKLMMVLTSQPQNVVSRSPCAAIVGALVLSSGLVLARANSIYFCLLFQGPAILMCVFVSLWRWLRIAMQEDRPFRSLLFSAQPSFWQRKINNVRRKIKVSRHRMRPNGKHRFKEVFLYTTNFLLVCSAVPINRVLVAIIWLTHVLSALLMQKLICLPFKAIINLVLLPIKALGWFICTFLKLRASERINPVIYPSVSTMSLGVVCLEGEDPRIVRQEFAGAANHIILKQHKRACTKPQVKAIISLLCTWTCSSSSGLLLNILDQEGAPFVENLHVEHGYQYGWALTIISLLDVMAKIEVNALGMSGMSERAMDAYWQAIEMVKVVDEEYRPCIVCSKETYASAVSSEWMKLDNKKPRWSQKGNQVSPDVKPDLVDQILKAVMKTTEVHITEFNKAKGDNGYATAPWTLQVVVSYTRHTVCQNLLKWWIGELEKANTNEGGGESNATVCVKNMVEHINMLIVEFLACCLLSLPAALDMSMTEAVHMGSVSKIEKGLFLVGQGKHMWAGLQWPAPIPPTHTLGQLRQWIHSSSGDV